MGAKTRLLSAAAVLIVLVALALVTLSRPFSAVRPPGGPAGEDHAVAAGERAAPFTLEDLGGRQVTLTEFRGKVVFLNLWATWCAPCREEMPAMERLYRQMRERKDFVMLAVSQDNGPANEVKSYVHKYGYDFPVLLDPKNSVAEAYGVTGVPETFIIDRDGRIIAHHQGPYDWSGADFRSALQELLSSGEG